jgi:hypothetical protein
MLPLEAVAVTLCVLMLVVIVATLIASVTGYLDPAAVTRCRDCSRRLVDTRHRPDPVCVWCRLVHHRHRTAHP